MKKSSTRLMLGSLVLAVLVIGGFLASPLGSATFDVPNLVQPSSSSSVSRSQDAQRKSDLQQIATALEFYALDNGGGYPNSGGCVKNKLSDELSDYLSVIPEDPTNATTSGVVTGACKIVNGGGYGYIPLNTNSVNSTAEGYLLVANISYAAATADTGIYYTTSVWTPTITGANATADYNLANATKCTSTTSACTSSVDRYYMIGR